MKNFLDLGVVIALQEEFREFLSLLPHAPEVEEQQGTTYYRFLLPSGRAAAPYQGVAVFIGGMGNDRSTLITDRLINHYRPALVAMLGIAGGVHTDIRLGDVIVASQVDQYSEGGKAKDQAGESGFMLEFGGRVYQAPETMLNLLQNLEFAHSIAFQTWRRASSERLNKLLPDGARKLLQEKDLLAAEVKLQGAHLAAGPYVVGSRAFAKWLHTRDRNIKAVDMESAGLMLAAHHRTEPARTLVLRGISDLADERKGDLDALACGGVRRYAMQNATDLLLTLGKTGLLPRAAKPQDSMVTADTEPAQGGVSLIGKLQQLLPKVFIRDADFMNFCQRSFPEVYGQFSVGMTRPEKLRLLLDYANPAQLIHILELENHDRFKQHRHLLE